MTTVHQRHAFNVAQLRRLAKLIERGTAEGTHFALVLFDQKIIGMEGFTHDGIPRGQSKAGYSTYISNAERQSMIAALEECTEQLRRGHDLPGAHPDLEKPN